MTDELDLDAIAERAQQWYEECAEVPNAYSPEDRLHLYVTAGDVVELVAELRAARGVIRDLKAALIERDAAAGEWSCSHCGPAPTSTGIWCDRGCGRDYNRMDFVTWRERATESQAAGDVSRARIAAALAACEALEGEISCAEAVRAALAGSVGPEETENDG